ncbi:MAG: protein kinase [Thermoanaerobaculia bacterium]|nr:protein kinase [Thermoanaerobaculia bacterium]
MTLAAGTRLGRYEVRTLLGAGGMGEVYSAYEQSLDREVAIKILRYGASDSELVHRFVQEAKAASALNHPNVAHVYETGEQDGLRFIAMEMVAGETLRERISRGPLSIDDTLDLALQITAALAAAHTAGIIHRDIKPENVMIRPDGYAKVLDFGLAKLRQAESNDPATAVKTATGIAMGTRGYMAPEQLAGEHVTAAADVYSLGVVLHEMIHGTRPEGGKVRGPSGSASTPGSPKLDLVIAKALAPNPKDRFPSAVTLHDELRDISRGQRVTAGKPNTLPLKILVAAIVVIAIAAGGWFFVRAKQQKEALALIPRAEALFAQRDLPGAYALAMRAAEVVPADDRLVDLMTKITQKVSIQSEPSGANIYLQRFKGPAERELIGKTPLELPRLMRGDYVVTVEKEGYAPATRPLSIGPIYLGDLELRRMPGTLQITMLPAGRVPRDMVYVGGGPYRLQGWSRASDREVNLAEFFIDRREVSNRDFEEFVRTGGYRRPELWGAKADVSRFIDTTGLPGPRSWAGGAPQAGRENYPVTDVTWAEAAAFAEWSGKKLPTTYQWERAGRYPGTRGATTSFPWGFVPGGVDVTERANFLGKGTLPVDSMLFGMSTWGAQHMAGNVSEWVRNEKPPGHVARGGSWNDATYAFGQSAVFPPLYSSSTLGFRCVKGIGEGETGDFPLSTSEVVPVYQPVDDRTYKTILQQYEYTRTPLNARVVETKEAPDWRREKITYEVAGKTVIAYLFVPRNFKPPFQVIHFAPAGDVESGLRSLAASIESKLAPHIRSGRAVFGVAMEGYIDRPRHAAFETPDSRSGEYADYVVSCVTELRRGLDYLETRPDVDSSRIAFEADSAGVWAGVILVAVEPRYRSSMFVGSGIESREATDANAGNRINFLPRIKAPKLTLQGRYDESSPYAGEFQPLYRLLREPKRAVIYEGPHVPPQPVYLRESQKWFDETLGKVRN